MNDFNFSSLKLPSWYYERIEKTVVSLFKDLGVHDIPIDPFSIAQEKDYILRPFSSMPHNERAELLKRRLEGLSFYHPDKNSFIICYNDRIGISRIKFTIMHEIGHIIMGHREESDLARKIADYFAAYALAPSPLIFQLKCEDYITLSDIFAISLECADYSFQRYNNWLNYGGNLKDYEIELISLFSS